MSSTTGAPAPPPAPAFTYSGDPSASPLDALRFSIGDTNPAMPMLSDGELNYLLVQNSYDVPSAAVQAVEAIITSLARSRDETVGSVSIKFSQDLDHFQQVLALLRRRLGMAGLPFAGGISISSKLAQRQDGDRVPPSFTRDMMQAPDDAEQYLTVDDDVSTDADGSPIVSPGG